MIKLFFNESTMHAIINNEEIDGNCITLNNIGEYSLQLYPCSTHLILQPIYTTLRMGINDELITALDTIRYSPNEYFIIPHFLPYVTYTPIEIISQDDYETHRITVYSDNLTHVCIENDTNYIDILLPTSPLQSFQEKIDKGILFIFSAENYLNIILYDYADYYNILEKLCDSYEFTEKGIIFHTELHDNQGRNVDEEYTFEENTYNLISENFTYDNKHLCADEILPIDFVQAVLNKDYIYAYNLIENTDLSMESMIKMFGEAGQLVNISTSICDGYIAIVTTIDGKINYLRFKFVVEKGKITDIIQL